MRVHVQLIPDEPVEGVLRVADLAREAGVCNLWVADSHVIWRDCMVVLGALAKRHPDCALGTAVSNFGTRTVDGLASAMATLAELTTGEVRCGVGLGDSAAATTGRRPSPVSQFVEDIEQLRGVLAGTTEPRLAWPTRGLPIIVGASGPRMLEVAGKHGDGAIILVGSDPGRVRAALDIVRAARADAGKDPDDGRLVVWLAFSINEDADQAVADVRSHAARAITHALPTPLDDEEQQVADAVRAAYDYREHVGRSAPHAGLLPDHIVKRFAVAGDAVECAARLQELIDVGVEDVGLLPIGHRGAETVERLAADVLPRLGDQVSPC